LQRILDSRFLVRRMSADVCVHKPFTLHSVNSGRGQLTAGDARACGGCFQPPEQ